MLQLCQIFIFTGIYTSSAYYDHDLIEEGFVEQVTNGSVSVVKTHDQINEHWHQKPTKVSFSCSYFKLLIDKYHSMLETFMTVFC